MNLITLQGITGKEARYEHFYDRTTVLAFNLKNTQEFTDKDNQQTHKTVWARIIFWNHDAQTALQKIRSGSFITIQGHLKLPPVPNYQNTLPEITAKNITLHDTQTQLENKPNFKFIGNTPNNLNLAPPNTLQDSQKNPLPKPERFPLQPQKKKLWIDDKDQFIEYSETWKTLGFPNITLERTEQGPDKLFTQHKISMETFQFRDFLEMHYDSSDTIEDIIHTLKEEEEYVFLKNQLPSGWQKVSVTR